MPNDIEGTTRGEESQRADKFAIEDEIRAEEAAAKRKTQKQREDRRKQAEQKKEREAKQKAEQAAKAEAEKKQERKKQQQESRNIMEEQRKAKQAARERKNNPKTSNSQKTTKASRYTPQASNVAEQIKTTRATGGTRGTKESESSQNRATQEVNKNSIPSSENIKQPLCFRSAKQTNSQNKGYSAQDIASALRNGATLPTIGNNLNIDKNKINDKIQKELNNTQGTPDIGKQDLGLNNKSFNDNWNENIQRNNQNNNSQRENKNSGADSLDENNNDISSRARNYGRQQNSTDPYNNQYGNSRINGVPLIANSVLNNKNNINQQTNNSNLGRNLASHSNARRTSNTSEEYPEQPATMGGASIPRQGRDSLPRRAGRTAAMGKKLANNAMKRTALLAAGPIIGIIAIVLVLVFLLIGTASFVMNMPGAVRDKLEYWGDSVWASVKGVFIGQDEANISDRDIIELATYLENMGFNMEYYGLATSVKRDEQTKKIEEVDSKYLLAYLAAEQRNYMIANENWNVKTWWQNLWNFDKWADDNIVWGTGMINLHEELIKSPVLANQVGVDYTTGFFTGDTAKQVLQRIQIHRQTNEMIISRYDIDLRNYDTGGYDVYKYKLDYWVEKYGSSLDFYLALHLATRAPEFAYKIATEYDTKVSVSIHEIKDVEVDIVYVEGSENGKVQLDEEGKPKMVDIKDISSDKLNELKQKWGLSDEVISKMKSFNRSNLITFTPYITSVKNHWYYKEVIYQGTPSEGTYEGKDINVYEERPLNPGDDGYVRFYAYTDMQKKLVDNGVGNSSETSNGDDRTDIKDNTSDPSQKPSGFGGLFGKMFSAIVSGIFSGDFSGISGILSTATQEMINEGISMLKDEIVDLIPDGIFKDMAKNVLNGLESFTKNTFDGIYNGNITVSDIDFGKITDTINIKQLASDIKVSDILQEANLGDATKLFNMAGIRDLNDLSNLATNIDISNLTNALSTDKLTSLVNNLDIDKLTDQMYKGIESEISNLQDSLMESYKYAFNNLQDMETYEKLVGQLTDGISDDITEMLSPDFMANLENQIGKDLDNILSGDMTALLSNEFSKQLTGLKIDDIQKLADIPDMYFDDIKKLGTQLTDVENAAAELEKQVESLANISNVASIDLTGIDVSTLSALTAQFTGIDKVGKAINNDANNILKSIDNISNIDQKVASELKNEITSLNNTINSMNNKLQNLDAAEVKNYSSTIQQYKNSIDNIVKTNNLSTNIQTDINRLTSSADDIVERIGSLDSITTQTVKRKLEKYTLEDLIGLSTELTGLNPYLNTVTTEVAQLGNSINKLGVVDIQNNINKLNSIYEKLGDFNPEDMSQKMLSTVQNSLTGVNNAIRTLSSKVDLISVDTLDKIKANLEDFDSEKAITLATQLTGLQNATFGNLLNQITKMPDQVIADIQRQLKDQIAKSVTENISKNLSGKLSEDLMENFEKEGLPGSVIGGGGGNGPQEMGSVDEELEDSQNEYITGFFVREIRKMDYFQTAEPILVPWNEAHWMDLFQKQKFIITDDERGVDLTKLEDEAYIEKYGKTIWQATGGQLEPLVYGYLQSMDSVESEYTLRFFKELFAEFPNVFRNQASEDINTDVQISQNALGWIFKTTEEQEMINTETKETITVQKGEYEPVNWSNGSIGILYSRKVNSAIGFKEGLDIVSPGNGVVVNKTERTRNELGTITPATVVIELKNTGDEKADGMRIIITGPEFDVSVGSTVTKGQVIGKTGEDNIKVMALSKGDHTQVTNIAEYIYPPYLSRSTQNNNTSTN